MKEKRQATCQERVEENLEGRLNDFREFLGCDDLETEDLGPIHEYGLCVDYVESEDKEDGYIRYQLSTGGPGDEFRYFIDYEGKPYKIEYWFLDWFNGAKITLSGEDEELMMEIWEICYLESALPERQ